MKNKKIFIWLGFHLFIFLSCLSIILVNNTFMRGGAQSNSIDASSQDTSFADKKNIFKINTNLFDIIPQSSSQKQALKAESIYSKKAGNIFLVLIKSKDFNKAKDAGKKLADILSSKENSELFKNISFEVSGNVTSEIEKFYFDNRFFVLDENDIEALKSEQGITDFISEAILNIFNGFVSVDLEKDPFLITENAVQHSLSNVLQSGSSMNLTDGVLCNYIDDYCYIMLRASLTDKGASITNKDSGVKKIYQYCANLKNENIEVDFVFSGIPFHSYESSSSAQKEITIITIVSIALIIILFLVIFNNLIPICYSVGAIIISCLTAFLSVLLCFRQIHILTFVFGTTLIGTCLDYSVHYFIRWKTSLEKNVLSKIKKGLTMSLVSTLLSYFILIFAPFDLLKQIAVFSFAGILSTYLTVICLYPLIPNSKNEKIAVLDKFSQLKINQKNKKIIYRISIATIVVVAIFGFKKISIDNSLQNMYSMKGRLLENEIESRKVFK